MAAQVHYHWQQPQVRIRLTCLRTGCAGKHCDNEIGCSVLTGFHACCRPMHGPRWILRAKNGLVTPQHQVALAVCCACARSCMGTALSSNGFWGTPAGTIHGTVLMQELCLFAWSARCSTKPLQLTKGNVFPIACLHCAAGSIMANPTGTTVCKPSKTATTQRSAGTSLKTSEPLLHDCP